MKKNGEELLLLARNALERAGAHPAMAEAAAHHLLRAEEHGLPTHGMRRFASEKKLRAEGIEIADELLAKIEKLAHA